MKEKRAESRISFTIYTEPVAQERARRSKWGGVYDPEKSRSYKKLVGLKAKMVMRGVKPLEGELVLKLKTYRSTPKSFSKKKLALIAEDKFRPITKPDASNLVKGVEDAMNGIVYRDDSQIVDLIVEKRYTLDSPRIEIEVLMLSLGGGNNY